MNIIPLNERFFESINSVLYCFDKALTESGISVNYYRKEKSEGNKRLSFLTHPTDRRFSLVAFETLGESHKQKIQARFGNPYNFITREPILKMLKQDDKAEQFFLQYRYNGDKILPIKRVKQYTREASILNLLNSIEESRNKIIKSLGVCVPDFYGHLEAIIESEKSNGESKDYAGNNQTSLRFPQSYRFLRPKLKEYKEKGYSCLIDKKMGNQLAAKINDCVAEAKLLELIEDPRNFDDVLICMMYNVWATENGYKIIEPATVGVWRRKKEHLIIAGREGNSAFNEKYIRQVKGLLPSVPLALVEHDDNNLDFLFMGKDGYEFNKYVSIVVIDSRTKLVLGKSYELAQTPGQWQIHHAYLDAMYYIKSLTGGWHLPFELKADKWAIKSLTPFYNKIAKFILPSHGNKHRGYIEPFFASPLWKRSQQLVSTNNWTANNITAKNRGVNQEVLRMNAKDRPMIGNQAEQQIENFFHLLRHMPDIKRTDMQAQSKEDLFLEEWNKLSIEDKRPITDEKFLLTFGIEHNPQGRGITIGNRGIEPQINNQKFSYDLPESWMYDKYIGATVKIIYDPFDMSRVLITNHDDIRFIATTAQLTPRALKDMKYTNSRTFLNAILNEKKDQVRRVGDASDARKRLVGTEHYNAEAMLQGGVIVKEMKNAAEQRLLEGTTGQPVNYDPLDLM